MVPQPGLVRMASQDPSTSSTLSGGIADVQAVHNGYSILRSALLIESMALFSSLWIFELP